MRRRSAQAGASPRPVIVPGQSLPPGFVWMAGTDYAFHRDTGEKLYLETTDAATALAMMSGRSRGRHRRRLCR